NYEDTLVISSFMSLNRAAYKLNMGIIFCEDLMPATSNERETSYKVVSNLFEVLNIFLFDKYEEAEIYSPILGMTDNMS
ncbi:MAG: HAD family phosphatase, partial [Coprobacillus sp.]